MRAEQSEASRIHTADIFHRIQTFLYGSITLPTLIRVLRLGKLRRARRSLAGGFYPEPVEGHHERAFKPILLLGQFLVIINIPLVSSAVEKC